MACGAVADMASNLEAKFSRLRTFLLVLFDTALLLFLDFFLGIIILIIQT